MFLILLRVGTLGSCRVFEISDSCPRASFDGPAAR